MRPLFGLKVFAGLDLWRLEGQNMGVCAKDGLLAISLSSQQLFPSSPIFGRGVSPGANHATEKKEVLDGRRVVSPGLKFRPAVRERTRSRISPGTHLTRRGIQRGRKTVPTEISAAGDDLRAQPVRRGLSQPAKPSRESSVQTRLASLARGCRKRMRDPADSRVRCLSSVQRVRTSQFRGAFLSMSVLAGPSASRRIQLAARSSALVWEPGQSRQPLFRAHRQCLRLRSEPLEIASGRGRRMVAKQRFGPVSPSISLVRASAASACEWCDSGACPHVVSNIVDSLPDRSIQAFSRCRASMLTPTKPWEVDAQERSRRANSLGAQHGRARHNPRGCRGAPRPRRDGARSLAGADSSRTPALAKAAGSAALRNGTDGATAVVVSTKHKVVSFPRNKQLPTSHHFPATTSSRHSTHPTILIFDPFFTVQFPSKLGDSLPQQCNMAALDVAFALSGARSSLNGHETSFRTTAGGRAEVGVDISSASRLGRQTLNKEKWSGSAPPARPTQKIRLAARRRASRSVAMQTEDSVNWLTPATVTSTATQTPDDGRSLHQWDSIQGQCWLELQKVQHSVPSAVNKWRDSRRSSGYVHHTPTAMLEKMQERLHNIAQGFCDLPWRVVGGPRRRKGAGRGGIG